MEIFLIRLLQFILAISLLVLLHEGGHMFFSKLFGVRVEKFFIFFDVGIGKWKGSLFHFKPKNSDTEYGMGWLPLGGYCKIAGMIDESFDTEQMKKPAEPWEFRSKPAWQRLLIMTGGVLVNFLLALFIYSMVLFYWGETYTKVSDMTQGMVFNTEAKKLGFQDHDILLGTDKGPFKEFDADLYRDISEALWCDVMRGGRKVRISLPGDINLLDMLKSTPQFVRPYIPATVEDVVPGSPADKIGIRKGDRILSFNGKAITSHSDFTDILKLKSQDLNKGMTRQDSIDILTMPIVFQHAGAAKADSAMVTLTDSIKIGYRPVNVLASYKQTHISYGFLESFPAGVKYGVNVLGGYVSDMRYVFSADGAKSLGGFGAIGSLFPPTWDWHMFWMMTAFLSIILAFMNILPIPALDGGHVLFLLYEMITRRKPSETFMIRAEYVGIGILLLLMVVANLNDILRWLGYM
ncbi:RIP metalloprotease RseP [Prevotella sp. kh1p2]|uniref:RIP metalloprotease RseP n=1 Tax=Prevotella sp. kh1p2 TaxID=1761883 RepID=UPI0008BF2337|nr:RIP metalloprotease RseP [Prevotella sp. kh1p2]SES92182.1 regulator of sigma E protease [Prevotella sp. kh1p2]SNU11166.1 regulator of sigma E protease [Prevotellaceae bacterium KH2P17]